YFLTLVYHFVRTFSPRQNVPRGTLVQTVPAGTFLTARGGPGLELVVLEPLVRPLFGGQSVGGTHAGSESIDGEAAGLVSIGARQRPPHVCLGIIFWYAPSFAIELTQKRLRHGMVLLGGHGDPARRFGIVVRHFISS